MLEPLFNKAIDVQACNVIKKKLQNRCFSLNIAKSLRAPNYFILIIICERLLLPLKVICKDFVDISYENASFGILKDSIWLQLIYFLTIIAFWLMKYLFRIDGDNIGVLTKDTTVQCLSLRSAIMKILRHCISKFPLFYNWRIKSSKNFPRNHAVPWLIF